MNEKNSFLTDEIKNNLEKRLEDVTYWNGKDRLTIGDTIYGKLDEVKTIKSTIGGVTTESDLAKIIDEDGEIIGIWLTTVISSKFKELDIQIGDIIAIRYLGQKKNYQNYSVAKI